MKSQSMFDVMFAFANPCKKKSRISYCGQWQGIDVMAITDAIGPQVVVAKQALSPIQRSHRAAEALGKRLVSGEASFSNKWTDMRETDHRGNAREEAKA